MRVTTLIPTCDVKGGGALFCWPVHLPSPYTSGAFTASSVQCLRLALTRQSLWTAVEWASSLELVRGRGRGGQGRAGGMGEGGWDGGRGGTGEGGWDGGG